MTDSDTPSGGALRRWTVIVACLLTPTAAITGCSGAPSVPEARSTPSTPASTPVSGATASATDDATVTAIRTAYVTFFNPKTSLNVSMTLLQDGPAFRKTLEQQAKTDFAKATTATVSTVTLNTRFKATVVYTILLSGKPVLVNSIGSAVQEDGRWKVAGATFCGLLTAQGSPPKICVPAATS
jgi:hypothetical protein